MICHFVLIRLKAETSSRDRDAFMESAARVLGSIPGVSNLRIGLGLGLKDESSHPVALFMDFEDDAALAAYQIHPEHQRFVNDIVGPIQDDKKVFDYRF